MPLAVLVIVLFSSAVSWTPGRFGPLIPAAGSATTAISAEIHVGFSGYVVPDVWLPVQVVLHSERPLRGTLEVAAPHPRSSSSARVQVEVHLEPSISHGVVVPVVVRDLAAPLTVRVLEGGRAAATWQTAVHASRIVDRVVLALADRPVGLDRLLPPESRTRIAYVGPEALPARWQLYEGVRAMVVADLDGRRVTPTQREALSGWIAGGGHLVLVDSGRSALRTHELFRPFLAPPPREPAGSSGPERHHVWGRGTVTLVPVDPFVPTLPPAGAAMWTRVLERSEQAPLIDRTLFETLPHSGGASPPVQVLIIVLLGAYLIVLRPLTGWLQRGASGVALALTLLAGAAGAAALLAAVARTQMRTLLAAPVAEVLGVEDLARVEVLGRVVLPRGGGFALRARTGTLVRPLAESATTLRLSGEVILSGEVPGTLPVRGSSLFTIPVRGQVAEEGEQVTVTIRNRTGATLTDGVVLHNRRLQPIGSVGAAASVILPPGEWREIPPLDTARGARARLLAWTLSRLRDGAIIEPTTGAATFLLAWLDDEEGGVLRWKEPHASLLVVVPLAGMGRTP